jgi:hypothetical protein
VSYIIGKGRRASQVYPVRLVVTGSPPIGPASGDLGANFPDPTVVALEETSGPTRLALGAIADGQVLQRVGNTAVGVTLAALSAPAKRYFQNLVGLGDPAGVVEIPQGAFSYSAPSLRYVLGSFDTSLNGMVVGGRLDVRDPRTPLALPTGTSMDGRSAGSYAVILDPRVAVYSDPETEYYRRLALLETVPLKLAPCVTATGAEPDPRITPLIYGPYGSLLVRACIQDMAWLGAGVGTANEMSQSAADQFPPTSSPLNSASGAWIRLDNAFSVPMSKGCFSSLQPATDGTAGLGFGVGGVAYYLLPRAYSDAGEISPTYVFRDDFMAPTLDPAVWTVTESAAGNVKIDTRFGCVKGVGNSIYTANGMISTATYSRSAQLRFVADAWVGNDPTQLIFGLNDGVSLDFSRYNAGLIVDNSGLLTAEWQGGVGSDTGVEAATGQLRMVRLRITPGLARGALFEIQGGDNIAKPWLGGATWKTISDTRAGSIVTAATFKIGFTAFRPDALCGGQFLSDVRVY